MAASNNGIFADIATRTGGDIYVGVVGPVRCGKSTFVTRFMRSVVLPRVENKAEAQRITDELPQSADGTAIMTTSPKFIPGKAVGIKIGNASMRVRMVDCVGFLVPGATGDQTDGRIRNVKTPWSDNEMPFDRAAEIGTKKVITEHSTIAIMLTTDGSFGSIPRGNFIEAEEKTIKDLKKCGKPFVVIMNSKNPTSPECKKIVTQIAEKHDVTVIALDVDNLTTEDINKIFESVLQEFGVAGFRVTMPKWLQVLPVEHPIINEAIEALKTHTKNIKRLSDNGMTKVFEKSLTFDKLETTQIDVATGMITYNVVPKADLYYRVISAECGSQITNEAELVAYIKHVGNAKAGYDQIKEALAAVESTGYGVVAPVATDYQLEKPSLYRNGKSYGVRLRATAPSLHIVKVNVATEVKPTIGSKEQSEDMLKTIQNDFEHDKEAVWNTNIFGKSLQSIVHEGIATKTVSMHPEAQKKVKRTLTKIVNNGKGGMICILL
jgi:stage IV sporulation protein A